MAMNCWTGNGTLSGGGGSDTVTATKDANFTLSNTLARDERRDEPDAVGNRHRQSWPAAARPTHSPSLAGRATAR